MLLSYIMKNFFYYFKFTSFKLSLLWDLVNKSYSLAFMILQLSIISNLKKSQLSVCPSGFSVPFGILDAILSMFSHFC